MDTRRSYTDAELRDALDSLLDATVPDDGSHLYDAAELSMLQKITATVVLDYQHYDKPPIQTTDRKVNDLEGTIQNRHPVMALAAEFKRASPSKGQIVSETVSAQDVGRDYADAGADIISVLTESRWFQGSLSDLAEIRSVVPSNIVLLRKDFVVNTYMIDEAKAAGADTVLLIVAVLPKKLLKQLIDYCRQVHAMEPLVEIHNAELELPVALAAGAKVIGVNNRNLHTFQMDMSTTERVGKMLRDQKNDITLCSLSGMSTAKDVHRYRQCNCRMVLIGESLMRSTDPKLAIRNLQLDPESYSETQHSSGGAYTAGTQLIKVCGITSANDALVACRSGANLIGVIFAPASPRCAQLTAAQEIVETVRAFGERKDRLELKDDLLETIRKRPAVVGVFQNQEDSFIRQMVQDCGLDMVQLHGDEGMKAANIENYGVPVIRVVDIHVDGGINQSAAQCILEQVTDDPALILLDTAVKGSAGGGTGIAFDWSIAEQLQNAGLPVIVAGGLTPDSVADCIEQTRPFGVDVSSGVEESKGVKDHDKVHAFVTNAKRAALESSKGF